MHRRSNTRIARPVGVCPGRRGRPTNPASPTKTHKKLVHKKGAHASVTRTRVKTRMTGKVVHHPAVRRAVRAAAWAQINVVPAAMSSLTVQADAIVAAALAARTREDATA